MAALTQWPWASPEATRRGVTDRLRSRYSVSELPLRQFEVASRRLLARLFTSDPEGWVMKGGVALLLRLDPSRASNDVDLAYVAAAGEHALAVAALERAFSVDLGDFFQFEFVGSLQDVAGDDENGTRTMRVRALIGQREWTSFDIDLARPDIDVPSERLEPVGELTGLAAVDALPALLVLPLSQQLAEKTCAMFERHGASGRYSTRARDLIDIAMISAQVDLDGAELARDLRKEQQRRRARGSLREPLPTAFELDPEQETLWRTQWVRATRSGPMSFDEAVSRARRFLDPLLGGDVAGQNWSRDEQRFL